MGFRPAMCEAPVGCDGIVQDTTARFAIETGQDTDAAGRLLPGIGSNAVPVVKLSWQRAIVYHSRGVHVIARQQGPYSFKALCQRPMRLYSCGTTDSRALAVNFLIRRGSAAAGMARPCQFSSCGLTIYTQIAGMPTIFCATPDTCLEHPRPYLPRLLREHPRCAMRGRESVRVKSSFANDVYFVVDLRQGQVAFDRGQVDGVGQAVCLCEQPPVVRLP